MWKLTISLILTSLMVGIASRSYGQVSPEYTIVEGQRFGPLTLGMTLAQVRAALTRPIYEAERVNGVVDYKFKVFPDKEDSPLWHVQFDPMNGKAFFIGIFAGNPKVLKFESIKGAAYGQTLATVQAIYGDTPYIHFEKVNPTLSFLDYYYMRIRTQFTFSCSPLDNPGINCDPSDTAAREAGFSLIRIAIWGGSWSPGFVK